MRRRPPSRVYYGWLMVGSALAINTASSPMNAVVFSFLIGPIAADLDVSKGALGLALTLRLLFAGLCGPWYGLLIDRHGARWLGAICGAIAGVSMFAVGLVDSLWLIYVLFAFSGLAGFGGPAGQLLTQVPLAKWFVANRGRALAIATTGMALGTTFTVPLTQWLVESVGWRGTTMIFGAAVAGVIVPVSIGIVRRAPEDLGLHPDGADSPPDESLPLQGRAARLTTNRDWTVREALRTVPMWLMLVAMTVSGASLTGTLIYRVGFWQSTGMAPALVGFGTALDPLCVVFSVLAFGMLADRIPIRYVGTIGALGLALSMVPMIVSTGQAWTILAHNAIWGISAGGWITLNGLLWPNYFGRANLGSIRGIALPVGIIASAMGAPLFGFLLDTGLASDQVWLLSLGGFTLAGALILFARPPLAPREPTTVMPLGQAEPAA